MEASGGRGDGVINMPTKFRLEVRSKNYNFSPSLTEFNQKLKSNSELVTFDFKVHHYFKMQSLSPTVKLHGLTMLCKVGDVICSPVNNDAFLCPSLAQSNILLNVWIRARTNFSAIKK